MDMKLFITQHQEIQAIVVELDTAAKGQGSGTAIRAIISRLAGKLNLHLSAEDSFLYPKLAVAANPAVVKEATAFVEEMGGLAAAFKAFSRKWTDPALIDRERAAFAGDWAGVSAALKQRISREEGVLYPLAKHLT